MQVSKGPPVLPENQVLVLDGAMGTEFERRGFEVKLPLWSAGVLEAFPDAVRQLHMEYLEAGANVLTANTFRTTQRSLEKVGHPHAVDEARLLTQTAVNLAREALERVQPRRPAWIAGSLAPLEDCYRPDLVPAADEIVHYHTGQVEILIESGVDFILLEAMNTVREAVVASMAVREADFPFWVSFVCDAHGRLLSGESLYEAIAAVAPLGPQAILVNCTEHLQAETCVNALLTIRDPWPGIYPRLGGENRAGKWRYPNRENAQVYAQTLLGWARRGMRILGGCCGTSPEHIAALVGALTVEGLVGRG